MKILLIEDHKLISEALKREIEEGIPGASVDIINTQKSLATILDQVSKGDYDLVLMDIFIERIIDIDGIELTKELTSRFNGLKVLILTGHDKGYFRHRSKESGAVGYVFKGDDTDELLKSIESAAKGKLTINGMSTPEARLDEKEIEIIKLYASGLNRKEVAAALFISARTLANRMVVIYEKLEVDNYQEMVRVAIREGYIILE